MKEWYFNGPIQILSTQDEEGGRRDIPNPFGTGAWDASYSGIHWQGGSSEHRESGSAADENARH